MSSSVCRPLKRAKSTVGVPLTSETLVPAEVRALTLISWTLNEMTPAAGASVPMTKALPVVAEGVVVEDGLVVVEQPMVNNAAKAVVKSAGSNFLPYS